MNGNADILLVTGAADFVATHIVKEALDAGYSVRGTVSRDDQAQALRKLFYAHGSKAEFVIVPDILAPNAYDQVLRGVTLVAHVAFPAAHETSDYQHELLEPAVHATTNILQAALKHPSVKRIVFNASIAVFPPLSKVEFLQRQSHVFTELDNNDRVPVDVKLNGPSEYGRLSKVLADRATWDFASSHPDVSFDIITIHSSFAFGPNLLQSSAAEISGTNALLWEILTHGTTYDVPGVSVHVKDVARAQVYALSNSNVKGGQKFLVSSPIRKNKWAEALAYAKRTWPERQWADLETPALDLLLSTAKAERELGVMWWLPLEKQIHDVVDQMIAFGA